MNILKGMNQVWLVMVLLGGCGLLMGASSGTKWTPTRLAAAFKGAPASAARRRNPYRVRANAVQAGRILFLRHCSECHGNTAEGTAAAPPLRNPIVRSTPDGVLFWFLKNGKLGAGMPSWSGLPPQQRWQIVSFLKSLR